MATWTRGNRNQILEMFEGRAAEFADRHIHGKPSIDGSSYHFVKENSQNPHTSPYPPHFTDAEIEAPRGHSACLRSQLSLAPKWYPSIRMALPKSTTPSKSGAIPKLIHVGPRTPGAISLLAAPSGRRKWWLDRESCLTGFQLSGSHPCWPGTLA